MRQHHGLYRTALMSVGLLSLTSNCAPDCGGYYQRLDDVGLAARRHNTQYLEQRIEKEGCTPSVREEARRLYFPKAMQRVLEERCRQ